MSRGFLPFVRRLSLLVLVFALSGLGLVHHHHEQQASPELASFLAAGGTLDDLCHTEDHRKDFMPASCDACRIADSVALAEKTAASRPTEIEPTEVFRLVAQRIAVRRPLDPQRLSRAPPTA